MSSILLQHDIIVSQLIQCKKCTHLVGAFFRAWVQNQTITVFNAPTKRLTAKSP